MIPTEPNDVESIDDNTCDKRFALRILTISANLKYIKERGNMSRDISDAKKPRSKAF